MSKLVVGNGEFLDEINAVTLDQHFGTTLTSAIDTINNNFKKLLSVPFLKGAHGENIQSINVPILDNNNNNVFTSLGIALRNKIYEGHSNVIQYNTWNPGLDVGFGGGEYWVGEDGNPLLTHSYDLYYDGCDIPFYGYIERSETNEKLIVSSQQIFIFNDSRLKNITDIKKAYKGYFVDLSSAYIITGTIPINKTNGDPIYNEAVFIVTKCNIIPTLYYDQTPGINEWCWRINGYPTQITAQGVKGLDGANSSCVVCYGTKNDGTPVAITITNVLTSSDGSWGSFENLEEGQLAIVWYMDNNKLNCSFGSVSLTGGAKVYLGHDPSIDGMNFDMLTLVSNIGLRNFMDDITNTENTCNVTPSSSACRGIWIPDEFISSPSDSEPSGNVHMFWSEDLASQSIHSGLVDYAYTAGNATPPTDIKDKKLEGDNSKFSFHYDTVQKDEIKLQRQDTIPGFYKYTVNIDDATENYIKIKSISSDEGATNVYQSISTKESSDDQRKVSLSSNGLHLIGQTNSKIYSTEVNSSRVVMNSDVQIGNSVIGINGGRIPNSNLSPLTVQENQQNLKDANNLIIHNQNVLVSNSSLLVGKPVNGNSFNAYTQHYANYSIYNFDYVPILNSYQILSSNYYYSPSRPRYTSYIPVSIGGWLSMYNSQTSNYGMYKPQMSEPVKLTPDENFRHTFMSGKFGYTGSIFTDGITTFNRFTNSNDIKSYQSVSPNADSSHKYSIATSMSGTWTKIGNVVDVKGKIFFTGVEMELTQNGSTYSTSVIDTYPLTYSSLYDFLMQNSEAIKFPLPVYLNNNGIPYISTGNVFSVPSEAIKTKINSGGSMIYDKQYIGKYRSNTINSKDILPNEILNGEAQIHFYGDVASNYVNKSNGTITSKSAFEALPNIFNCSAGLRTIGNTNWSFFSLPKPEAQDLRPPTTTSDAPSSYSILGTLNNDGGPIRFTSGNWSSENNIYYHFYDFVSPNYIEPNYYGYLSVDNFKHLSVCASISTYLVRYITFSFSYLLDDDIYGYSEAKNSQNNTRNYDSESWPTMSSTPVIQTGAAEELQSQQNNSSSNDWSNSNVTNENNLNNNVISGFLDNTQTTQNSQTNTNWSNSTLTGSSESYVQNITFEWGAKGRNICVSKTPGIVSNNISNPDSQSTQQVYISPTQDTVHTVCQIKNTLHHDGPNEYEWSFNKISDVVIFPSKEEANTFYDTKVTNPSTNYGPIVWKKVYNVVLNSIVVVN